jgi:hypothetical protein
VLAVIWPPADTHALVAGTCQQPRSCPTAPQLRAIQTQIRREEEAIREAHHAETRSRAEQDLAAKLSYFILKQEERDGKLDMRQKVG